MTSKQLIGDLIKRFAIIFVMVLIPMLAIPNGHGYCDTQKWLFLESN